MIAGKILLKDVKHQKNVNILFYIANRKKIVFYSPSDSLRKKCPLFEVILVHIFPHSD